MPDFYPPPVDRLLTLGTEPARRRVWPDYRTLGLEDRHVPALIRMATDPALHAREARSNQRMAPVHAWRALGELEAAAAVEPLLALLRREKQSEWVANEIPAVLGMIGAPALSGATLLLFDEAEDDEVRIIAADAITAVAFHHPDRRDEAVAVLAKQLEDWSVQSHRLNGYLVTALLELEAVDTAPLMEAAYAANAVDLSVAGSWENAQVDLGLLPERTPLYEGGPAYHPAHTPSARAAETARRKRKAEKAARKRNRKKK